MENAEEVLQSLDSFSKLRPKNIPRELEEYLCFVARTGEPVFHWSIIKSLFREKLLHVLTEFHDSSPGLDLPPCPNVDPFNYDTMKNCLLERIDSFSSAPFTVQRICELLTCPRKQYSRIDKYMRAIEKNILVVSTREPGAREQESDDLLEAVLNGDGFDMHIEIEMDGNLAWKEAAAAGECPVSLSSYPVINDNPNCIAPSEPVTNCIKDYQGTTDKSKQTDSFTKHDSETNSSTESSNLKIEPEIQKGLVTDQNVLEVNSENLQNTNNTSDESLEQNAVSNESLPNTIQSQQQPPEAFLTNDTEENTDNSETDSNLTEDSVTSESQENPVISEENPVISDVENSNDEAPFLNVQEPPSAQLIVANDSQCAKDVQEASKLDYSETNIQQNINEIKPQVEKAPDAENLFKIVCERIPEVTTTKNLEESVTEPITSGENFVESKVQEHEEPAVAQEVLTNQENIGLSIDNSTVSIVTEAEPEQMVADVVENNFIADIKPDEALEQDQVESMDIPESAMECEETPVISEPMDQ